MQAFFRVISNIFATFSVYRIGFFTWRLRLIIQFLISYFLWNALFATQTQVGGYTQEVMMTYLCVGYVVASFVTSTRTSEIGDEINNGDLSNALLRPQSYAVFILARDCADRFLNLFISLIEIAFLIIFLHLHIFATISFATGLAFVVTLIGSSVLYALVSTAMSLLGFWTNEMWSVRFLFFVLLQFLGGSLFPPDLFPTPLKELVLSSPFAYFFYFPTRLLTQGLSPVVQQQGFLVMAVWIIIFLAICMLMWKKGLQRYGAEGR